MNLSGPSISPWRLSHGDEKICNAYQLFQKRQRSDVDHLTTQLYQDIIEHAQHGDALRRGTNDVRYFLGPLQQYGIQIRGSEVYG